MKRLGFDSKVSNVLVDWNFFYFISVQSIKYLEILIVESTYLASRRAINNALKQNSGVYVNTVFKFRYGHTITLFHQTPRPRSMPLKSKSSNGLAAMRETRKQLSTLYLSKGATPNPPACNW
jgi:hypothetical protein